MVRIALFHQNMMIPKLCIILLFCLVSNKILAFLFSLQLQFAQFLWNSKLCTCTSYSFDNPLFPPCLHSQTSSLFVNNVPCRVNIKELNVTVHFFAFTHTHTKAHSRHDCIAFWNIILYSVARRAAHFTTRNYKRLHQEINSMIKRFVEKKNGVRDFKVSCVYSNPVFIDVHVAVENFCTRS